MATMTATRRNERPGLLGTWAPFLAFPMTAGATQLGAPAWVRFWTLTLSLFAAMKWMTLVSSRALQTGSPGRILGYLFLWPGMDVDAFFAKRSLTNRPRTWEWLAAAGRLLIGLGLIQFVTPWLQPEWPRLATWVGLVGIALLVLFGLFDLLSLAWRTGGVGAWPIMRGPHLSTSVTDYWGRRWNLAFRDFAHRFVFRPTRAKIGSIGAMLAVFLFSGAVHDLVISGSTGVGWGKPTLFFLFQGLGILFERSAAGRRFGLGHGPIGWAYCMAVVGGPLTLNFTRPFLESVVVPTLGLLGAW